MNNLYVPRYHNSQGMEPITSWMDEESIVYTHYGIVLTIKNNEIASLVGKWTELEITMLSEISQIQNY